MYGSQLDISQSCNTGPCRTLSGTTSGNYQIHFKLKGSRYVDEFKTKVPCGTGALSFDVKSVGMYSFVIKKAEWIDGQWIATALKASSKWKTRGGSNSSSYASGGYLHTQTLSCDSRSSKDSGTMVRTGK